MLLFILVYEAVLPLPTCMKDEGCRSVIRPKDLPEGDLNPSEVSFDLIDDFNISTVVRCRISRLIIFKHMIS